MVRQFRILQEEAVALKASPQLKAKIDDATKRAEEKLAEMLRALEAS